MRIDRLLQLALTAILAGFAVEAFAAPMPPLSAGAKIKVETTTSPRDQVGTLVALGDSTLSIRPSGEAAAIEIPRSDIAALSVATGQRSRWRKAFFGFGIGAVSGFLLGYAQGDDEHGAWDFVWLSAEEKGLVLAALFAPTGGIVGLALRPGDRWSEIPVETIRAAPQVTSRGVPGIVVTVRF